jgi:hypothetical protein
MHKAFAVSLDDDDEEEDMIKQHSNDVSKPQYRNHRQFLLLGTQSSPEPNAASSSSTGIPLWVSNEESLIHHRVDEE